MKKNLMQRLREPIIPAISYTAFFAVFLGIILGALLPAISGMPFLGQLFSAVSINLTNFIPVVLGLFLASYVFVLAFSFVAIQRKDFLSVLLFSVLKGVVFTALLIPVAWIAGIISMVYTISVISIPTTTMTVIATTMMTFVLTFFVYELTVQYVVPVKHKKYFAVATKTK